MPNWSPQCHRERRDEREKSEIQVWERGTMGEREKEMMRWEFERQWEFEREDQACENWYSAVSILFLYGSSIWSCLLVYFYYFYVFGGERWNISKKAHLLLFLTKIDSRDQTKLNIIR